MKLEIGKKYQFRGNLDKTLPVASSIECIKIVEIVHSDGSMTPSVLTVRAEYTYIDKNKKPTSIAFIYTLYENGQSTSGDSRYDLVEIGNEPTASISVSACAHPRKTNISFNEANPVWACAICGKDWKI